MSEPEAAGIDPRVDALLLDSDFEFRRMPRGIPRPMASRVLWGAVGGSAAIAGWMALQVAFDDHGVSWFSSPWYLIPVFALCVLGFMLALAMVSQVLGTAWRAARLWWLARRHGSHALASDYPWHPRLEERSPIRRVGSNPTLRMLAYLAWIAFAVGGGVAGAAIAAVPVTWIAVSAWLAASDGKTRLTYVEFPYAIPGEVTLRFGLDEACSAFESLWFTLRCIREEPAGSLLPRRSAFCKLVWVENRKCGPGLRLPAPGSDVDVAFELPPGLPGTRLRDPFPTYWELRVAGKSGAGPYEEHFLVPIYAGTAA